MTVKPPKSSAYAQNKQSLQTLTNTIFQFSYVFQPEISQKEFFTATIYPCFEKFFRGENLLIFSYGVTNSGKTYTMQGTNTNPGLIPRTLDVIFSAIKDNMETKKLIYRYKPDRFNEICALSDAELSQEMAYKETLLRLATHKVSSLTTLAITHERSSRSDHVTAAPGNGACRVVRVVEGHRRRQVHLRDVQEVRLIGL